MDRFDSFILGVLAGVILLAIYLGIIHSINPPVEPLDVYQGKTTLEITYKDSIPIDSVVVFKEEFIKK
jgi:hypothetical protein